MWHLIVAIALFEAPHVAGIGCYRCSDSGFDGEPSNVGSCFIVTSSTSNSPCFSDSYCRTQFRFEDGIVTSVYRSCAQGATDHDASTATMPAQNKCNTDLRPSRNPVEITNCYYHCNTDNCNNVGVSTLKTCSSDCSRGIGRGYCNYISGECQCNTGYTGSNCSSAVTTMSPNSFRRKCVQCNSEADKGCKTKTEGTYCPGSEQYCSSAQTSIYTKTSVVRTILIRACTNSYVAADECKFTSIYSDNGIISSGYKEFTCYSTCNEDNCNTNTPDGVLNGNEKVSLQCVQCTRTGGDCLSSRTSCPSESTHCQSTVTYAISEKKDTKYNAAYPSSYQIINVERRCATAAVDTQCTESSIGYLSFKTVTCQETCQEDGCNTGWPARPKCIQCSTSSSDLRYGNDVCLNSPSLPSSCPYPYQKYCVIKDTGLQEGTRSSVDGYPRRIQRGCSYVDIGKGCNKTIVRDKPIQTCNYTCTTDGCNVGSGFKSLHRNAYTFVLVAVALLYWTQ